MKMEDIEAYSAHNALWAFQIANILKLLNWFTADDVYYFGLGPNILLSILDMSASNFPNHSFFSKHNDVRINIFQRCKTHLRCG